MVDLARELERLIGHVQEWDRPLPWVVHSGCSYRRIASEPTRENGYRSFTDGNVLHALNQRSDGHPDLSMGEGQLNSLVGIINLIPAIIEALNTRSLPPSDEDWGKVLSRAFHEHLSRRDIMQYLDNEEDCAGLAQAALTALTPLLDKVREGALEELDTWIEHRPWCQMVSPDPALVTRAPYCTCGLDEATRSIQSTHHRG